MLVQETVAAAVLALTEVLEVLGEQPLALVIILKEQTVAQEQQQRAALAGPL
jgi:hypothetical protein